MVTASTADAIASSSRPAPASLAEALSKQHAPATGRAPLDGPRQAAGRSLPLPEPARLPPRCACPYRCSGPRGYAARTLARLMWAGSPSASILRMRTASSAARASSRRPTFAQRLARTWGTAASASAYAAGLVFGERTVKRDRLLRRRNRFLAVADVGPGDGQVLK